MLNMKKLLIVFIVLSFCSCKSIMDKQEIYLAEQNKGKFTVDLTSPQFKAGETSMQFISMYPFAPLRTVDAAILYYPVEDAACIQFKLDTYTFHQFWNRESREAFIKALDDYNKDYDAKKLTSGKSNVTKNIYGGGANGYLTWQAASFTMLAKGDILFDFGYYFREKSPFFTVTASNAVYVNLTTKDNEKMNSGERIMHFTRAQASAVADFFKQEHLQSVVPEAYRSVTETWTQQSSVKYDDY